MQETRNLAVFSQYWKKVKGVDTLVDRIDIDHEKIDIFHTASEGDINRLIGQYENAANIPDWDAVSKVYFDIETYSNNEIVLQSFIENLEMGILHPSDFYMINFVYDEMGQDDIVLDYLNARINTQRHEMPKEAGVVHKRVLDHLNENFDRYSRIEDDIDPKAAVFPHKSRIVLIGLINERQQTLVLDAWNDEVGALKQFFDIVTTKQPEILGQYNGFEFDLPYVIKRAEIHGIYHPFYVSPRFTQFTVAQRNSNPTRYQSIWVNHGKTAIIDLYHQTLAYDYVARKLVYYDLKNVCLQLELRKEARLNLSYPEMKQAIESGNISRLQEYLIYDLEDTFLLGDYLIPAIYYQKEWLPDWKLQSLSTGGMGSKWNSFLLNMYEGIPLPKTEKKYEFQGGLTGGYKGVFRNVSKIDIQSMYPHIMIIYLLCSYKDTEKYQLKAIIYFLLNRIELKGLAKKKRGTAIGRKADQRQGSEKVKINSGYGALSTQGIEFNDYVGGACITAYGRAILTFIINSIREAGGTIASFDTDGVMYSAGSFEENKIIHEKVNKMMPGVGRFKFDLDYEFEAELFYVPPGNDKENPDYGLRKNYILITRNKDGILKYKAKGKYVKRDRSELEKTFLPKLLLIFTDHPEEVINFYDKIIIQLINRSYPVEKLSVTRKIKVTEKRLIELEIGRINEVRTFWRAKDTHKISEKTGKELKAVDKGYTKDVNDIDWEYYINEIKKQFLEFCELLGDSADDILGL